ncbi:HET-domain-containing protein [Neurospora crassa]|uniref:Heterokaryon incompatibility domain-containing protein n=1 Tax=Neurospora crassa (strain ATCC 24698 / 74-OR23-1A / CBS 708.71 / DSM 1257 / FGSC 987) TaxID=367110 RepID=Q7S190_NEUCR|nr:hypothetical protein NCU09772 [Neurospora crassa OR74A]EAA29120.1 hypothetical protein NCU09772 [Neurospora crassa OR74A]KHE79040.1 HET-domain-containing protein [Neurospora crassa]|eukprot:XP_958356.1 hypothetical protein NCU09772 [Neurospora crassa OR74A]
MSQQLHNTKGQEDDKGQEQSRSAPLQRVPATFAKLATRIRVPRFLAGSAHTQLSAGVGTTTTSLPARVQRQKQELYHRIPLLRGQIRLLQLLPHENDDGAIHCRLFCAVLDSRGTRPYEALSYVWGSGGKPRSIFIDGCDLAVGENLYAALLHLRDPSIERTIWIDAICINQEDPEEKGHQVQYMAKIYAKATRVVVWLGEEAADSGQALENLRIAADVELPKRPSYMYDKVGILPLLQRSWFQRIWVLQEVGAARHILIKCGSAELDGFAFCSGLNALDLLGGLRADVRARILSATYLIRGAIFRPRYATTSETDNFSLDIRPLGELIDMYRSRQATERHDKVYALLGMCSDNPTAAGLSADYTISWVQLLNKVIHFSLSELVSVGLWDNQEIAFIEGKGCVLGQVSSVQKNATWEDRQDVVITWRKVFDVPVSRWSLLTTAKSIQKNDTVYLLQGASRPTILRPCNYHWVVIKIAVYLEDDSQAATGEVKWSELLQSVKVFPHDFRLSWDWDMDPDTQPEDNDHDYFARYPVAGHSKAELRGCLDAASKIRTVRLALEEGEQIEAAYKHIQEEVAFLDRALKSMNTLNKDWLDPEDWENEDAKKLEARIYQAIEERGQWRLLKHATIFHHDMVAKFLTDPDHVNLNGQEELQNALWAATAYGYIANAEKLLNTGKVDAHYLYDKKTAVHVAAESGHEALVDLFLNTYKVDPNIPDGHGQTALHCAARYRHTEAAVKVLLDNSKVDLTIRDDQGKTALDRARGRNHVAVVKLISLALKEAGLEYDSSSSSD